MKIIKSETQKSETSKPILYFEDRGLKKSGPVYELTADKYPKLYKFVVMNMKKGPNGEPSKIEDHYNQWLKNPKGIVFPYLVVKEDFFNELEKEYKPQQRCFHICLGGPEKVITRVMGVGYMNEEIMELQMGKRIHGKTKEQLKKMRPKRKPHGNPMMAVVKKK